jgi:hypothetical protein
MSDVVHPEFPPAPWAADALLEELRLVHAEVSTMPEVMVHWDLSEGQNLPGQQAAAATSQILASLVSMISWVEDFAEEYPGKRIETGDAPEGFWTMLVLAQKGAQRHQQGQT